MNLGQILDDSIKSTPLSILVFGPDPKLAGAVDAMGKLAQKRIQIRDSLRVLGHETDFPEELLVGINAPPKGQLLWYEGVLASKYDLVIILAQSPGSTAELGYFAAKALLAGKTQVFINEDYQAGLVADGGHGIELLGGQMNYFKFPDDLDLCNLQSAILALVTKLQRIKYFS